MRDDSAEGIVKGGDVVVSALRWLAVLPGALLAMVLSPFPLHFVLYQTLTGSGVVEPYPELPERVLMPFVAALAFQWAGVRIAPSRKRLTSFALLILWVIVLLCAVLFVIRNPEIENMSVNFRYGALGPVSAIAGAIVGFLINRVWQRDDSGVE